MILLKSFFFTGSVCLIGQIILDNTKLSSGHITALFVVIGSFLDIFNIYDKFVYLFGAGALLPITSFGHTLVHSAMQQVSEKGIYGLLTGMLDLTSTGISAAIIFAFIFCLLFRPKN